MSDAPAAAPTPSLLRTEAERRASLLRVELVEVWLDLTAEDGFTSTSRIVFSCTEARASTFVDLQAAELHRVVLNGVELTAAERDAAWRGGRLALGGLQEHNELLVCSRMAYSSDGEGLHRHVDAGGEAYLYAMSFLDAAPRWFCCFDQPDLKARYRFHVTAPEHWLVRGNAPATRTAPGVWQLATSEPLASYFVTMVAGPYLELVDGDAAGTPEHPRLRLLARRELADELHRDADEIFAITRSCMTAYQQMFASDYPFGTEYSQAFVPDFNAGAMENPGCVVFREQYLFRGDATRAQRASRAGVIAHEMAHQWFGDLVTMRWWDELWLNESFAEYLGHRVAEEAAGFELWTEFGLGRKLWGRLADLAPSTHPIAGNGADDARAALANFDGISYAKGASVLRQLVARLGDDAFLPGLREHFSRHAYGNATMADLMDAWRSHGAEGLDGWAERWLTTTGMDTLRVVERDGALVLTREGSRPHTLSVAFSTAGDGASWGFGWRDVTIDADEIPLEIPAVPGTVVMPDARDECWARLRPCVVGDPAWWRHPGGGVAFCSALHDGVLAGEVPPGEALDTVLGMLGNEIDDVRLRWLAEFGTELAGRWSAPEHRAERRARLATELRGQLAHRGDQGDAHRVLWRALLRVSDDADLLRAALEPRDCPDPAGGPDELNGAHLAELTGPDERWAAIVRLVTLGESPAIIDAELARDDSAAARLAAATARAAIPTPEVKRAAMELVLSPSELPTAVVQATAAALFPPEQHQLTRPLAAEWLQRIGATAEFRRGWALSRIVTAGFPCAHSDAATLRAADEVLAAPGLDAGVARALTDAIDLLRHQHRAIAGDAAIPPGTTANQPVHGARRGRRGPGDGL